MKNLADEMTLFADQIREYVQGDGTPPAPAVLGEWLAKYRETYRMEVAKRLARVGLKLGSGR